MNFNFLPSGPSFGNPFVNHFNGPQKMQPSFGSFCFGDMDQNDGLLPSAKAPRSDDSSPCDFFAATRQSTDITNFSENTPIDVSNFFDMQGCAQPTSNFSLVDAINWDCNYLPPHGQFLQQQGQYHESKEDFPSSVQSYREEPKEIRETERMEEKDDVEEWGDKESNKLMKLAEQHKNDWKKIAKLYTNKRYTPAFLKAKYKEIMSLSAQKRVKFTHKEDIMIAFYFEKYGSNWTKMATFFDNRTGIMLKNRYYSFIRKKDILADLLKEVKGCDGPEDLNNFEHCQRDGNSESHFSENIPETHAEVAENLATHSRKQTNNYKNEIRLLNMKIRSLKALCTATRRELEGIKQSSI